jgi:hypothetical protein
LSFAAVQESTTRLPDAALADSAVGADGAMSSTNVCVALADAVLDQVAPAVTFVVNERLTTDPLGIPAADATFIVDRRQYAKVAPGARVPVRAPALVAAATDVHVPT